jgi:DNA-binding NarL/FixJ family response regulator
VDDDQLVLASLRLVLRLETDCVVWLESDPRSALETVSKTEVDVVISDFLMPHMDGVSFLEEVRRLRPAAGLFFSPATRTGGG